jgi:hypothetical protein
MPSAISSSVIGGGSANGSSLNYLGKTLFGCDTFLHLIEPTPNLSKSLLQNAP